MPVRAEITTRYVLDSSAMIAMLLLEPGGDMVAGVVNHCVMSSVNFSESLTILVNKGMPMSKAARSLQIFRFPIEPFDDHSAFAAAALRGPTMKHGLSFGDRACLALAQRMNFPVMTADKAWAKFDIGVEIKLIR